MRVPSEEFQAIDLDVHRVLADVALHDVSAVDLPGGGDGRTLGDVRKLLSTDLTVDASPAVRLLFSLRQRMGRVFGWDREIHGHPDESYVSRLDQDQRERSLIPPDTADGPFRALYLYPRESLSEIRNATVHAFSCMALVPLASGYRLYWAIYVRPVSRLTPVYMGLIEPFRRFIVYPAILRRLRVRWTAAYGSASERADG